MTTATPPASGTTATPPASGTRTPASRDHRGHPSGTGPAGHGGGRPGHPRQRGPALPLGLRAGPRAARHALQQGHGVAVEQRDGPGLVHRRRPRTARGRTGQPAAGGGPGGRHAARLADRHVDREGVHAARDRDVQGEPLAVHARRAGRHDDRGQDRRDRAVDRCQVLRVDPDHGRGEAHGGLRQVSPHQVGRRVPHEPVPEGADLVAPGGSALGHRLPRDADRHRVAGAGRLRGHAAAYQRASVDQALALRHVRRGRATSPSACSPCPSSTGS